MRTFLVVGAVAGILVLVGFANAERLSRYFLGEDFMSVSEVCPRWGEHPVDVAAFRSAGDELVRAEMACSILRNKRDYIGLHAGDVRDRFGAHHGYFNYDSVPAYLIETAETTEQDSWQIVFMATNEREIYDVRVHKNCCKR